MAYVTYTYIARYSAQQYVFLLHCCIKAGIVRRIGPKYSSLRWKPVYDNSLLYTERGGKGGKGGGITKTHSKEVPPSARKIEMEKYLGHDFVIKCFFFLQFIFRAS